MAERNPYVLKIIAEGISFQEWRMPSPCDVLKWLKAEGNDYHEGISTTFLELCSLLFFLLSCLLRALAHGVTWSLRAEAPSLSPKLSPDSPGRLPPPPLRPNRPAVSLRSWRRGPQMIISFEA
eukprot:1414466-Pyramimonas_sp.AAC.1